MRFIAATLALIGTLGYGVAQASVLDTRGLAQGSQIFSATDANLLIIGSSEFVSLDSGASDPLLTLNGLSPVFGTPLAAADFSLNLAPLTGTDFLSGAGVEVESLIDSLTLLFARDGFSGAFASTSPFLLVVITGGFGDALSASTSFAGQASVALFNTTSTTAIPLPASLPLLLAGLGTLAALRRRA